MSLDFFSDIAEKPPADLYSNQTAKITNDEAGSDFIWIFQDIVLYLAAIPSIQVPYSSPFSLLNKKYTGLKEPVSN